jgi:hypothetical protein
MVGTFAARRIGSAYAAKVSPARYMGGMHDFVEDRALLPRVGRPAVFIGKNQLKVVPQIHAGQSQIGRVGDMPMPGVPLSGLSKPFDER